MRDDQPWQVADTSINRLLESEDNLRVLDPLRIRDLQHIAESSAKTLHDWLSSFSNDELARLANMRKQSMAEAVDQLERADVAVPVRGLRARDAALVHSYRHPLGVGAVLGGDRVERRILGGIAERDGLGRAAIVGEQGFVAQIDQQVK